MSLLWVRTKIWVQLYFINHSLIVIISLLVSIWMNHDFWSLTFQIPSALMGYLPAVYFKKIQTTFMSPSSQVHTSKFNTTTNCFMVPSIILYFQYQLSSNVLHRHHPTPPTTVLNHQIFQTRVHTSFFYTQVSVSNDPMTVWSNQSLMMFLLIYIPETPPPLRVFPTSSVTTPKAWCNSKGRFTRDTFTFLLK